MGWGTFLFFAISTYVGVGFVYLCLPELKDRSLESMDDLFDRSIWTMWRHAYPTEEEKERHGIQDMLDRDAKLQGLGDDEAKSSAAHKETKVQRGTESSFVTMRYSSYSYAISNQQA
ncbi:H(+)/hexose cotransporter 1 [Apiospora saccharicola]|uniref:H(+)/hexose cotransporter 1 n=1 Tax=Apiospora saccharicola TaxID=335842 RepID=A0ABR1U227_9PEZI